MSGHSTEHVEASPEPEPASADPAVAADSAMPLLAGFGGMGGMGARGLRRLPPRQRADQIARLNAGSGNAAVTQMIARLRDGMEPPDPGRAVKIDLGSASDADKLAEIQRLLTAGGSGAGDGLFMVWSSFGDLKATAMANGELFAKSTEKSPMLLNDSAWDSIKTEFKAAVEAKISANLEANRNYVMEEMKKLGISGGDADPEPTADQDKKLAETQKLAELASKALKAKAMCQTIPVGTVIQVNAAGPSVLPPRVKTSYKPSGPPTSEPGYQKGEGPEFRTWEEVDKEYKVADAAVQKILASDPAVFALVSEANEVGVQAGNKAAAAAAASPGDARKAIKPAMVAVLKKIEDATGADLDYRDFIPVHEQLMAGGKFSGPVEKAVIKHDVEGHETMQMLRSLGLGALSAAAFILAEFVTAGFATFLLVAAGVGASATNAGLSINDYMQKKKAAEAKSGNPELDIMSKESADSALMSAIIDTVFVFLDGAGAVAGGLSKSTRAAAALVKAAEEGAAKAATHGLAEALAHGGEEAAKAIERAVTEVGVEGTVKASGKSAEQLAEQVGKESELGKRITAAAELAKGEGKGVEELAGKLKDLGKLGATEAQAVAKQAIDQFGVMGTVRQGGGWKNLTKALGKEGPASAMLMEWRESLVRDLEKFIAEDSQKASKAVQTGTQKSAVSDIDISTFGDNAAENVKKAKEFIAGRAGCESKELETMLDLDVFADPTRMHLQDVTKGLTDEVRRDISRSAAKYEEQLIFARRIYDARQAGNEALAQQITKDAEALGVKPFEGYKPLSKGQIDALQSRLDGLVKKLETATEAEKKAIIEEVGQTQGQILAEGKGGYATGGGVRVNVSERPIDKPKMPELHTARWPETRYTAILAEGPHMDAAAAKLAAEGKTAEEYAAALKNLGKHGNRVTEVLGGNVYQPNRLSKLGNDLEAWVTKAADPDFVKSLKNVEELNKMRAEIQEQLTQLKASTDSGLKALREEAELGAAMTPDQISKIQTWTEWRGKVISVTSKLDNVTPAIFETLHAGSAAAPTGHEDENKGASVPDKQPNQSTAPAPPADDGAAPPTNTPAGPGAVQRKARAPQAVSRWPDGPPPPANPDAKVKIDVGTASEAEKIAEIQRLQSFSGMAVIDGIQQIWYSFPDLQKTAKANPELFMKSAEKLPRLVRDDRFDPVRKAFKEAVEAKVSANLEANRNYVNEQMKALGISGDEAKDKAATPSPEEDKKLREVQMLAEQASKAQKAKAGLRQIGVGTLQGMAHAGNEAYTPPRSKVFYDPSGPPSGLGFQVENKPGFKPYAEVDKEYKAAEAALQKILASNPAVYALVSQAEEGPMPAQQGEKTAQVAKDNPADARNSIRPMMKAVLAKIEDAAGKVGDDLDYRDFIPVHDQLMSSPAFSGPIEKAVIKADVEGHETMKMLRSLGLGALSAAAFILAEFATGGMATFLLVAGLAATGGNAALSISDYMAKRTAAEAKSGDPRLDIVSDAQADSALITAVIDSVFVFVDGAGVVIGAMSTSAKAARGLLEAAEAGAARAATHGLTEAIAHGGEAAVQAIEKSVTEVGIAGTVKASGKSAEQLAEQVGKETELGKRIIAAGDLAGKEGGKAVEELAGKLAKLSELTDLVEKEAVVKQAIDQFGIVGAVKKAGGWKAVTKSLGETSAVNHTLMEWRESLVRDLERYIAESTQGASKTVQTGTEKSAVSDIDISTFGDNAAENVKKAREFIAKRAGCDSTELEKVLDLDVFADPSRMHLQDVTKGLTDEMRRDISRSAAKYEEQLIFGRRLYDARKAGNEPLAQQIMKEAEGLGIKPFEGYKPLSKGEIDALNARLDGLVKKLETAAESEKKQIIEEVGQTQGQILAEGGGGYATGGGVRLNVTERPIDLAKMPKTLTPRWPEVRYTAILAEGPHMDSAVSKLALEGKTAADYAGAIKNVGKHGNRITTTLGADIAHAPEGLTELGNQLASWVEKAKDPNWVKSLENVEELSKIRSQIAAQLDQLKAASAAGTKALREEAELGAAMTADQAANIQFWTKADANLARFVDTLQAGAPAIFEGLHQGADAAVGPPKPDPKADPSQAAPTGNEDDKKQASVQAPQQNSTQTDPQPAGVARATARSIARQGDWHGPSYARHGPEGSGVEESRGALSPQSRLGESERQLSAETAKAVGWIGDGVMKLFALEADLRKSEAEGKPFFGENTLEFADRVHQIGEALQKLSIGVLATYEKVHDANAKLDKFEDIDKATKAVGLLIHGIQGAKSISKTNDALAAFQAKPSAETADAWADGIVDSFDIFGKTIGALELPPGLSWIVDYWQGLFGAPKAYVGFFRATMKLRYSKIDAEVGRFESYHEFLRQGEKAMWAGPATSMVQAAWMFDAKLQEWIFSVAPPPKPSIGGRNLWDFGPGVVATILLDTLGRDKTMPDEQRSRWMSWLSSQK